MTLEQIDQALTEWRSRLALAGNNLLELDDIPAYQRVRGGAGRPGVALTGTTLGRIGPALAAADSLWQSLQQLTEIVKKAEALRASIGRLWTHDAERRQIEFLLTGASVQLPAVAAPFAQRGLLSVAEHAAAITPDQLLAQMTRDFAVVKEAVLALESVWSRLEPSLASAEREAASLQVLADRLGIGAQPDNGAVRRALAALRDRVGADPFGVDANFASDVSVRLEQVRAQLGAVERERDRLDADLKRARALLGQLDTLQKSCRTTLAECRDKVEAVPTDVPGVPADLSAWLQSVEEARALQQWKPARIGLDRWLQAAEAAQTALTDAEGRFRAALERRDELRGLLSALQAKARALAARGAALDPALPGIARDAEQLLHGRPTPLERAGPLVAEYERRLLMR